MNPAEAQVQVYSRKLGALEPFQTELGGSGNATHHNLFREFFNASFTADLAKIPETKKTDFAKSLLDAAPKFCADTMQPYLQVLALSLLKGPAHAETAAAAVSCCEQLVERIQLDEDSVVLDAARLHPQRIGEKALQVEEFLSGRSLRAVHESKSAEFAQVFLNCIPSGDDRQLVIQKLCDNVHAHWEQHPGQKMATEKLVSEIPYLLAFVKENVDRATSALNDWLRSAPAFPSTPTRLVDILANIASSKSCALFKCTMKPASERFLQEAINRPNIDWQGHKRGFTGPQKYF
jgi:hypothetical protein